MKIQKAQYKVFNGTDFDKVHFETAEDMLVGISQQIKDNGYRKLPGGLILQWGVTPVIADRKYASVIFPITFPNSALIAVGANRGAPNGNYGGVAISIEGKNRMSIGHYNGAANQCRIYWIAIGY